MQKNISELTKDYRKGQGLTQEALASALSVSRVTVANWETGAHEPDLITLVNIANDHDNEHREFALDLMEHIYGFRLVEV